MSVASPAPIRLAPPALWRIASAFVRTLHALFGAPERVAFLHTLPSKTHGLMSSWLRVGEAMMRRLILIEAAAYPKPNARPLLPRFPRKRARKAMSFEADRPQEWRVSFRCFAREPRTLQRRASNAGAACLERLRQLGALPGEAIFICREERDCLTQARSRTVRRRTARRHAARIRAQDRFWVHEDDLYPPVFRAAWPLAERYEALLRAFNDPIPHARRVAARLHATPHRLSEVLRAPPEAHARVKNFDAFRRRALKNWRPHFSSA